jgi:hypothetical protein
MAARRAPKKSPATAKQRAGASVGKKERRPSLPTFVIAYVWARAAGRCEFPGCNKAVWKDVLTTKQVNVGKLAHIVAAKADGARGDPVESPRLAQDPSNIMLLCGTHHDLVDNKLYEHQYPKELLRDYKVRHQARIERLTGIAENMSSMPILVEIPVGAYALTTPAIELSLAISDAGRYPDDLNKIHVPMNGMTGRDCDDAFWDEARLRLARELDQRLAAVAHSGPIPHASVFAFGPMPLLIELGHRLDEKMVVDVYNRVRTPPGWSWPKDARRITKFEITVPGTCPRHSEVGLMLSVTSQVQRDKIHTCVPASTPVFELAWSNPRLDCLRSADELAEFVVAARDVMERIHRVQATRVHLFPAVPVAAAVEFGRSLQKKLHPPLALYDFHQASGGWKKAFELVARAAS